MCKPPSWFLAAIGTLMIASAGHAAEPLKGQTRLADGFDYPVGKPDAEGYYKARGFRVGGHPGEDWNGASGGSSDLGDPTYSIGNGIVILARDVRHGWGNVVIVRHAYKEGTEVKTIDALFAHLDKINVREGQSVIRGQQVGTIGTNRGMYEAHLHFELRKNITIGMARSSFSKDFNNYFDPSKFIASHRVLKGGGRTIAVALNTFVPESNYAYDAAPASPERSGGGAGNPNSSIDDFGGKRQFRFIFERYNDDNPGKTRYVPSIRPE